MNIAKRMELYNDLVSRMSVTYDHGHGQLPKGLTLFDKEFLILLWSAGVCRFSCGQFSDLQIAQRNLSVSRACHTVTVISCGASLLPWCSREEHDA